MLPSLDSSEFGLSDRKVYKSKRSYSKNIDNYIIFKKIYNFQKNI